MPTPQELRNLRLKNDYKEMCNIRGSLIQWKALHGTPPIVDSYELIVSVRTIIGPEPSYRDRHVLNLQLPSDYPNAPPLITMTTRPQPFHPNWFANGRWCHGQSSIAEGLGNFVIRMVRTLQYDTEITNPDSPANAEARDWYRTNLRRGWFPCDTQQLPDPTTSRLVTEQKRTLRFRIEHPR